MRSVTGRVLVVLALALSVVNTHAQRGANASLRPVQSGTLSAGNDPAERQMCLNGGAYVLAFRRGVDDYGVAGVFLQPNDDASLVVSIERTAAHETRWAWRSFTVDEPECYTLAVLNGRTRVYVLRVAVSW